MSYPIKFIVTAGGGFLRCWIFVVTVCLLNLASCTGPTGPEGPQGPQGVQGPSGAGINTDIYTGTFLYTMSGVNVNCPAIQSTSEVIVMTAYSTLPGIYSYAATYTSTGYWASVNYNSKYVSIYNVNAGDYYLIIVQTPS